MNKAYTRRSSTKSLSNKNKSNNGKIINAAMPTSQQFNFHLNAFTTGNNGGNSIFINGTPFSTTLIPVNDLFGINQSSVGSLVGYNQWINWYNRYLVKSVVATIEFVNIASVPVYVGMAYRPIEGETWNTWTTFRNLSANTFPNVQVLLTQSGGSKDRVVLKLPCNLESLWGLYSQHRGDLDFSGSSVAGPILKQELVIFALSVTGANATAVVATNIKIDFNTTMYQLKTQSGV